MDIDIQPLLQGKLNFWVAIVLIMIGLWAMITKRNLVKKLIGMVIFQSAIILFFVSAGVKEGATIPIIEHDVLHPPAHEAPAHNADDAHPAELAPHHAKLELKAEDYTNPLPHVLMLTAIVVGVATLGVALALVSNLHRDYGTLEEPQLAAKIRREHAEDKHTQEAAKS